MPKRLKSFEHGSVFVLLESDNGTYTVELYVNDMDKPARQWSTTALDAAAEMYHETCQATINGCVLID